MSKDLIGRDEVFGKLTREVFDSMKAKQELTTLKRYLELMSKKIKGMYGYTDKEYDAYRQGLKDCARYVGVREYDFDSREYDLDSSGDDNKEYYHYEIPDDMEG